MKFLSPPNQRFACRDCPARCCRLPWRIRLTAEESQRYLADAWVRERIGAEGTRVLEGQVLPLRRDAQGVACVFLDDDELCSLQKRFDHAAIPQSCQAFPFGFVKDESGAVVVQLSELCPSIRDNTGELVAPQLAKKLKQKGEVGAMAKTMMTSRGAPLTQRQTLGVARNWEECLGQEGSVADILARLYDVLQAFDTTLEASQTAHSAGGVTEAEVNEAFRLAVKVQPQALTPREKNTFYARALFAVILGRFCSPSRHCVTHGVGGARPTRWGAIYSLWSKLVWFLGWGTVDLLWVGKPVRLSRVARVERFLAAESGSLVREYLLRVVRRRQIFCTEPKSLLGLWIELAFAAVIISHFARCHAAAENRRTVLSADVQEGISIAELGLLNHSSVSAQGGLAAQLVGLMIRSRESFRGLLEGEL